jgi:hypothetical protein
MIEGNCPKCGKQYWGWSLLNPRFQSCTKCGTGLLILEDGKKPVQGYSPFTAEEYKMELPYQPDTEHEKGKLPL